MHMCICVHIYIYMYIYMCLCLTIVQQRYLTMCLHLTMYRDYNGLMYANMCLDMGFETLDLNSCESK